MKWRRLSLRVDGAYEPQAAALLESVSGALPWAVSSGSGRTGPATISICVPAARADAIERGLRARLRSVRQRGILGDRFAFSAADVADEEWATSWKRFFKPQEMAPGWWVVPSWEDVTALPARARAVRIDPGMAFGTGQHPTTQLALQLIVPLVKPRRPMLDIGCGSGILGIIAAMRGARVYGSDMDPIATASARANFRRNGVRAASICTAHGVPAAFPRAPLIAANITADALAPLAERFAESLTPDGRLVTSGVVRGRRDTMLRAFERAGLRVAIERRSGEWYAFVHRR